MVVRKERGETGLLARMKGGRRVRWHAGTRLVEGSGRKRGHWDEPQTLCVRKRVREYMGLLPSSPSTSGVSHRRPATVCDGLVARWLAGTRVTVELVKK
jgi:hypothetical protein